MCMGRWVGVVVDVGGEAVEPSVSSLGCHAHNHFQGRYIHQWNGGLTTKVRHVPRRCPFLVRPWRCPCCCIAAPCVHCRPPALWRPAGPLQVIMQLATQERQSVCYGDMDLTGSGASSATAPHTAPTHTPLPPRTLPNTPSPSHPLPSTHAPHRGWTRPRLLFICVPQIGAGNSGSGTWAAAPIWRLSTTCRA